MHQEQDDLKKAALANDEHSASQEQKTSAASMAAKDGITRVIPGLTRVTRQLPSVIAPAKTVPTYTSNTVQRERIQTLIVALSDTTHPLHQRSVDELTALGPAVVPQLCDMLSPDRPWLSSYRAAEALGRIGDGRASGPLLEALNHPNANVRWSAIRALATVGDARALLELRRVARADQGKTSWGESVGGAAQSVLEQMRSQNILLHGADLVKTAIACVFMLVTLIMAWSFVTALREELQNVGDIANQPQASSPIVRTAVPTLVRPTTEPDIPQAGTAIDETITSTPAQPAVPILARVIAGGNVRAQPARISNNVIGSVREGDQLNILAVTPDKQWYRVSLSENVSSQSRITTTDKTGWVSQSLLGTVQGDVPIEEVQPAQTPTPSP